MDDEEPQYGPLLSTRGEIEFEVWPVRPLLKLANEIGASRPSIVALDYRLDECPQEVDRDEAYKAGVLAQQLRDKAIADPSTDFPIVLVSNEAKLQHSYSPDKTAHDLFDRVYRKEEIDAQKDRIRSEVISLAHGYEGLRQAGSDYRGPELFGRKDAVELLTQQDIASALERAPAPHIAAKFILRAILDRPGLLVDDDDAAAILGISRDSIGQVVKPLEAEGVRYSGIFGVGWRRWWRDLLLIWAERAFDARATSLANGQRTRKLNEVLGTTCTAALSPWTGRDDEAAVMACASCRRGTEIRHSVAAFAANLPRFAIRPRICWDCIQSDAYLHAPGSPEIDESDLELAAAVKTMRRDA